MTKVERTEDTDRWDARLLDTSGSPLLSSAFLSSLHDPILEPIYLDFREGGQWVGGISGLVVNPGSFILKKSGLFRSIIFYSGINTMDGRKDQVCLKALINFLKKNGYVHFRMMEYDNGNIFEPPGPSYNIRSHNEFVISLRGPWEEVFDRIRKRNRKKYERSKRSPLEFRCEADPDLLEVLFSLREETSLHRRERGYGEINRQSYPYLDIESRKNMLRKGCARLCYVKDDEAILSMQLLVLMGARTYSLNMGTSSKGYETDASLIMDIETMRYLHGNGFKIYNIGGLPKIGSEGLEQYKLRIGAVKTECRSLVSPIIQGRMMKLIIDANQRFRKRGSVRV